MVVAAIGERKQKRQIRYSLVENGYGKVGRRLKLPNR